MQVFNVGADRPYTLNQLAAAVASAWGVEKRVNYFPARLEVKHAEASHAKLRCFLPSVAEAVPLGEGLRRMVAWWRQVSATASAGGAQLRASEFKAVEIKAMMPPSWLRDDMREVNQVEHTKP